MSDLGTTAVDTATLTLAARRSAMHDHCRHQGEVGVVIRDIGGTGATSAALVSFCAHKGRWIAKQCRPQR